MFQQSVRLRGVQFGMTGAALMLSAIACSQEPISTTDEMAMAGPNVVVTTSVLCDLTRQIAQETIDLTCLLAPGQDPHTYQSKPSDRQAIDEADLVLYDGYGFAPSMIGLIEASDNAAPKVAVYEVAVPNPLMGEGHDHDHAEGEPHAADHSEEHGDDHDHAEADPATTADHDEDDRVADPHIWHNAVNNGAIAAVIADSLVKMNPAQAELYEANAAELTTLFAELDTWMQAQVDTIPPNNRKLVTTHDSFRYFADAYGMEVKGALGGLSTQERPSPKTLTSLVDQVKAAQVPAIFAESTTNPELINAIAQNAEVKVADQPLFVEGPGTADSIAPSMQAMLVANTCTIVNALGGTCEESAAPE